MIKGTIILMLFLPALWTDVFPQQLSHQVLVPVAGLSVKASVNYSQTVGETAIVIFKSSDFIITQGFQQPSVKLIYEKPPQGSGVKVYPNPVTDFLTIELFGNEARVFRIDFINITGTIVFSDKKEFDSQFWYREPFNIENLPRGIYLIRITSEDRFINRSFKIEKV
jgi:hypothetical protein